MDDAIKNFKAIFLEKTGNKWEDRKRFEKKAKFFDLVDMDTNTSDAREPDTKQVSFGSI